MNPWATNPAWQNFSSLYREGITAQEARTGMERSHHLTASLYFGVAALQAFLNQKMRMHLEETKSEEEICEVLRKGKIIAKLKQWPLQLLGKELVLNPGTMDLITFFNEVRGDLTHPKTQGHDIYERLDFVEPSTVVDCVAEYIMRFCEAEGTRAPYWVFGWNYLNPRQGSYEIFLINEQQFCFSLQGLGFNVPPSDAWLNQHLGTYDGYLQVKHALASVLHCQRKAGPFPFMPILCRRWWTAEHQRTCGGVSGDALQMAKKIGTRK